MASIKDYVKYYKNFSFQEIPFNDIDSIIFSEIIYADFENIIPSDKGKYILFSDAVRLFLKKYDFDKKKSPKFIREVFELIDSLNDAKRYANIKMYYYVINLKFFCFDCVSLLVLENNKNFVIYHSGFS